MNNTFENVPRHVAIIMDGNGRWARNEGKERLYGHQNGVKAVREVVTAAKEIGVEYLTVYAFSTENWGRPQEEVGGLLELIAHTICSQVEPLRMEGIKLRFIGDTRHVPQSLLQNIELAESVVVENPALTLVIALNYGSRQEITEAVREIVRRGIACENITEELVGQCLQTGDIPDPDLLIRTSGEERLSNFMLWQLSYSELYFTDVLWPQFNEQEFYKAIECYNTRNRRFGLTK